jgi:hypothetical protein
MVTVDGRGQTAELPSNECDVTIRSSREPLPKVSCELLGRIGFVPVGAPDYVRSLWSSGSLDWSRATLIHTEIASEDWETWAGASRIDITSARKLWSAWANGRSNRQSADLAWPSVACR